MGQKVIQIEGPDGSGKSYLAQALIHDYKAAYIHVSNYPDKKQTILQHEPMMAFGDDWAHQRNLSPVVLDRHWLTLFVYSMIFDSQSEQVRVLNFIGEHLQQWRQIADRIVFCLPPKQEYLTRFEKIKTERPELYTDMSKVYDAFWALYYGKRLDNPVCHTLLGRWLMDKGGMATWQNVRLYDYTQHLEDFGNREPADWAKENLL